MENRVIINLHFFQKIENLARVLDIANSIPFSARLTFSHMILISINPASLKFITLDPIV